jgi:hypothetical protein
MMFRKAIGGIFIGAAAFAFATSTMAEALNAQPGLWKVVVETMSNGKVLDPRTNMTCFTKDQIDHFSDHLAKPRKSSTENCERTSYKQTATTVRWSYKCSGYHTITTDGELSFDSPTHYTGHMKTESTVEDKPVETLNNITGTRIGDCPPQAAATSSPSH